MGEPTEKPIHIQGWIDPMPLDFGMTRHAPMFRGKLNWMSWSIKLKLNSFTYNLSVTFKLNHLL